MSRADDLVKALKQIAEDEVVTEPVSEAITTRFEGRPATATFVRHLTARQIARRALAAFEAGGKP